MTDILLELLKAKGVTTVGLLLVALVIIGRMFFKLLDKQEIERKERYEELTTRSDKNEERLLRELREIKDDRAIERKEWLDALNLNTEQLKNVADKLEAIPRLQQDVDNIKLKLVEIEHKM